MSQIGTQYAWDGKTFTKVGDSLPICGERVPCGGECCLAPGHALPVQLIGYNHHNWTEWNDGAPEYGPYLHMCAGDVEGPGPGSCPA